MPIIALPPAKGAIETKLDTLATSRERAEEKVIELAKKTAMTFEKRGYDVTIEQITKRVDIIEVVISANKEGVPIDLSRFNPFLFKNPPIKVPNGTVREELNELTGETFQIDNMKEDTEEAMEEIIVQALDTVLT